MGRDRGLCPAGYRFLCLHQKDYALKFLRDVMCGQNLGPKDVVVVTLCDHSLLGSYRSSHLKLTRDFILGFGPYPVLYFYPEKPREMQS